MRLVLEDIERLAYRKQDAQVSKSGHPVHLYRSPTILESQRLHVALWTGAGTDVVTGVDGTGVAGTTGACNGMGATGVLGVGVVLVDT
jgi:hypothetical protein